MNLGLNIYVSILIGMVISFFVHDTLSSKRSINKDKESDMPPVFIESTPPKIKKQIEVDRTLEQLIGLKSVKENISNIVNLIKVETKRGKKPTVGHYIFQGNPGTGKTTVGRIIGKTFKDMKFLKYGHFIEVTRDDLVGQYQGHTTAKTTAVLESALGGVLFIDEAYSLVSEENDMFGLEAINTIVPFMENHRDEFVLIIAGYTEPLNKFLKTNVGLKSRFNYTINFEDYNATELYEIFKLFAKDFHWNSQTDIAIKKLFKNITRYRSYNFGNGRDVRKLFETIKQNQSNRLISALNMLNRNDPMLFNIQSVDIPKV